MAVLFETQRLIVRQITDEDVEPLLAIFGDALAMRHYGSGQPWDRAAVERMLAGYPFTDARLISEPGLALAKSSHEVVGYGGVGYFLREGNTPDLMFILNRAHWGRGFATELAQGAITTAFSSPQIATIYATVKPENRPSLQVLEKCGLRFTQSLPERDRLLYSISRGEANGTA